MMFAIDTGLKERFPGLHVLVQYVDQVTVGPGGVELQAFKENLCAEVKRKYSLESLKDVAIFRSYRDFFW